MWTGDQSYAGKKAEQASIAEPKRLGAGLVGCPFEGPS